MQRTKKRCQVALSILTQTLLVIKKLCVSIKYSDKVIKTPVLMGARVTYVGVMLKLILISNHSFQLDY